MSAAEARRRMKADLQAQLDRLTAQEEEERYSRLPLQHEQHRSYQTQSQSNAGPSYRASSSRPDVISPTWPQSQAQAQPQSQSQSHAQRNEWSSTNDRRAGSTSRHREEHTHSQSSQSAFQRMPEPTPMITSSQAAGPSSAPWQRNGSSSVQSRQATTGTYTPPTPDTPNMPNPLSASFVNAAVPSKYQLHEYLVNQQKQPLGLGMGWSIEGHIFDVYDLFVAVVRLGGSPTVSRGEWWPALAVMLGIPPSINTPHGLRASTEAARQLFDFFTLHLGTLETMWEATGPSHDAFGKTSESRMLPPVSATRGDGGESRNSQPSTYPPPPPQHRESSSSHHNRPQYQSTTSQSSSLSTSMPLHVHPSESSSTAGAIKLQQPPRKNVTNGKSRQHSNNGVNGTSFTRGQPAGAPSVSPVLHQPVPARLESQGEPTTIDPRLIPIHQPTSSSSSQPPAQASQPAGSSTAKALGMPPLSGYNPPKFASFDHLVATNALTLPKLPPHVVLNLTGSESEIYAERCFELRGVVKKIQAKEQARQVSKDEMVFWQKLLAILRHNPSVVIPGSQSMSAENVPHVPLPASQQILNNAAAGPSNAGPSETTQGQPQKKKRGRKPKNSDPTSQPALMEIEPNGELVPSTQEPPAKRRRGPGKPKPDKIAPAGPETDGGAAVAGPTAPDASTVTAAVHNAVNATGAEDVTRPVISAETQAPTEGGSSQSPKPRKPYTIRVGPDGTPLSNRFKKRLETGNLGYVEIVRNDSQATIGSQGDPGPSTLYSATASDADAGALGEVDPDLDMSRFEGPNGLAAFDAAIGYRDEDFAGEPTLSQLGGSSTGPGTNGHIASKGPSTESGSAPNSAAKVKNPKMVEASKRRWERRRQEQVAARLATGNEPLLGWPSGAPMTQTAADAGPQKKGGFGVPGAAMKAANKRWSLQHAALTSGSTAGSSVGVFRATPSSPMVISSPKRIISLSTAPTRDRERTPRAGSLKPRSSLPLHLTPSRRAWSPVEPQEMEIDHGPADGEFDVQWLPEPTDNRAGQSSSAGKGKASTGKGKAVLHLSKQAKAPRSSLPNHLADTRVNGSMGPSLSNERPTRAEKGKGVDRDPATPDPLRFNQTRREKAIPEVVIPPARQSLPSQRASSVALSRPSAHRRPDARTSLSPARQSQPPPSQQPRFRLVPEIELITPRRYLRLSPVRPVPVKAEVSPIKVETRPKPKPKPAPKVLPKDRTRAVVKAKAKPRPKRNPIKYLRVVIPIRKRRRADLILQGHYDPFRDDDSEDESQTKRYGHSGLRPKVPLPRGSQARTARPQAPEVIVSRFVTRGVEVELEERYREVLSESTILKRTSEQECGWKGCDAVLASEWHLTKHVELRRHAAQGIFKAGTYGEITLYRCHWEDCEQPCFSSLKDLEQHLTAKHISRVLICPYPACDLMFSTLSHLTRHAVKHHDSPSDRPVPLADLCDHIPPPPFPDPPQHLPASARTDILTTPLVNGSTFKSFSRQEWCKLKVQNGSYAPDEPVLHIEHPPHILQPFGAVEAGGDDASEVESVYTDLEGGVITEERLLDESLGRPTRTLIPVVDLKVGKRSKVGTADDIVHDTEAGDELETSQDLTDLVVPHLDGSFTGQAAPVNVDEQDPQGDNTLPAPLLAEEIPMDLGESAALEDHLDTETTYSPLVGPRSDDLFDLSDNGDGNERAGDASGDASESEVWAELEDQEMTQAFTPAGGLGDYEVSDAEDEGQGENGGMDKDEQVGEEAIRAAILSDPLDSGDRVEGEGSSAEPLCMEVIESDDEMAAFQDSEDKVLDGEGVDVVDHQDDPPSASNFLPTKEALDTSNITAAIAPKPEDPGATEEIEITKPTAAISSPRTARQSLDNPAVESEVSTKVIGQPSASVRTQNRSAPATNAENFTVAITNRFAALAESTEMDEEPDVIETGTDFGVVVSGSRGVNGEETVSGTEANEPRREIDDDASELAGVERDSRTAAASDL